MPTLKINNEDIYYEIAGNGPPLVLIHSLGTSSALWQDAIVHWKNHYTVVAMDCRGQGKSSHKSGITLEAIALDLRSLLDRLQLGVVDVIGISMGGLVATHFYRLAPEQVRSIVLADTFAKMPEGEARIVMLRQKLEAMSMVEFGKEYAAQTLLPTTASERHQELAAAVAHTAKDAYLQTVQSLFTQDIKAALAEIKVPALVVIGDQDFRTPIALSNEIMSLVPGARMEIIPQAAHLANIDNPSEFYRAIDTFLATLQ